MTLRDVLQRMGDAYVAAYRVGDTAGGADFAECGTTVEGHALRACVQQPGDP